MKLFVTPSMLLVLYVASSVVAAPLPLHVEVDLGLGHSRHHDHSRDRHGRGHGHPPQDEHEFGGSNEHGIESGSIPEGSYEPQPVKRDLLAVVQPERRA
ncbi:hypothetical protein FRB91_005273 [Serendipita sp. 411]|nr:hypothetical protein FRB91_005273 [Serendipita sp. 411]